MAEQRLALHIAATDHEAAAALTRSLRREILDADVDSVEHPRAATPPPGAKGDALEWANLIVGFSGGLPALIGLIRSWSIRNRDARVTLTIDDDLLELSDATASERSALIAAWIARHSSETSGGAAAQRTPHRDQSLQRS